ncbi:Hypothetical predicted protein [Paramuricea clavata]|uniref:Uncharacterized protein n=1 Tax=Paramuricea clavata TaxID=317549 RepID=A0A6S7J913_PARCT|nr:Hypothetical predicted protein [Paramuricea clavata]
MQDYGSSNLLDVGVINADVETSQFIPSCSSFERSTLSLFFGYSVGSHGITIHGKGNNGDYNGYYWKHGDIIELLLDCDATMLFLNTPTGKQFQVELFKWTKFSRLFVSLNYPKSGLGISELRKE